MGISLIVSLQTHLSFVKSHGRQGSVYFLINKTNNDNRKHSTGDLSSASPFVAGEVVCFVFFRKGFSEQAEERMALW